MTGRPLIFSDKENVAKAAPPKGASFSNSENQFTSKKKPLSSKPVQGKRVPMARIPLGGKDSNMMAPGLSRSQSTLNTKNTRPKVFLPRPPVLSKANSSLGFSHSVPNIIKPQPPAPQISPSTKLLINETNETKLGPQQATREHSLIPNAPTDSLVKRDSGIILPETQNLASTITPRTQTLHASNITIHDVNYNNVDPVKKLKRANSDKIGFAPNKSQKFGIDYLEKFNEELIQNDYSLEYVPKPESPIPYVPADMDSLNKDDLESFFRPHARSNHNENDFPENGLVLKELDTNISFGLEDEVSNDGLNFPKVQETVGDEEQLGLSVDELYDLLD